MISLNLSLPMVREAKGQDVRTPEACANAVREEIANCAQECFVVLTLNTKYRIIDKHLTGLGTLDACLVHPREIFRAAIMDNAAAIVLIHNHPSGDPTPSAEDLRITRQLIEGSRIIDISILDHVIIGRPSDRNPQGFSSLRESGLVAFT